MELTKPVVVGRRRVVHRRVVAAKNHVHALQAEYAVRLWPTPVVADDHAGHTAKSMPGAKTKVAHLEITLLQILEWRLRAMVGMPGQMDLAVFADKLSLGVHQDRGIEAALVPAGHIELAIAEVKTHLQFASFIE